MKKLFSLFLLAVIALCAFTANASEHTAGDAQALADGIVAYNVQSSGCASAEEWVRLSLTETLSPASEWYIMALGQYGTSFDREAYADRLVTFLQENTIVGDTTKLKYALALVSCGRADAAFVTDTANSSIGAQGLMSYIYGLHLLTLGVSSDSFTPTDIVDVILSQQKKDGGWAVMGDRYDTDVTAMTVQALAPYYYSYENVRTCVDRALELLSRAQLDNGGFKGFGGIESLESTAQVVIALCALGTDPETRPDFVKNGASCVDAMLMYRLADGSFCHVQDSPSNLTATVQAFEAFVSLWRTRSHLGPFYVFDGHAAEVRKASGVSEADAVSVRKGMDYKTVSTLALILLALPACALMCLKKKHRFKNCLFVVLVASALACVIWFTDIRSTEAYYSPETERTGEEAGTVTLTIRCDTVLGLSDAEYIPADGVILPVTEFAILRGDTVYDVLTQAARTYRIQLDSKSGALGGYGLKYIAGINHLYEYDFGELSGWVYHVNGISASVGCGDYVLRDGDEIAWLYTRDLGEDVKDR
ncbi:MAG: DUF4430 domain-containing protein [Clostridia bacterium]|nr:DUF4430 domain-containing protein [Clostridia bacterium]